MSEKEPREEEVIQALQRLLAWPDIARSGQLAKFLKYIVERKLAGEAQSIKAYTIAVDVFGRPADFDPQADPIVRVQARRLRALISQFYHGDGAGDAVRIELPTGRYVPEFVRWTGSVTDGAAETVEPLIVEAVPGPGAGGRFAAAWFLLAALAIAGAAFAYIHSVESAREELVASSSTLIDPPTVLVTDFQSLTGDIADLGMAAGLAVELVGDLGQFEMINVRYGGGATTPNAGEDSDFVLSGIVRRESGGLQYSAILTETATGSVVWNRAITFNGSEAERGDLLIHAAERFSLMLGSPRGPLHRSARALVEQTSAFDGGESLYLCRVLFDLYRERASQGAGVRAANCFESLGEQDRKSGQALAAMASLNADNVTGPAGEGSPDAGNLTLAADLLDQAVQASPVSAFVWEQRARLLEMRGLHDLAEAAYSTAMQINPANTDAIAARARHLALIGRQEAAERLMERVIPDSPSPPAWYYGVPALMALRLGHYEDAIDYASLYSEADRELGPILAVMAGQGLGNADVVTGYLPRVLDHASFRAAGVLTQLRLRISDEALLRDIRVALLSAGVPPAALNGPF